MGCHHCLAIKELGRVKVFESALGEKDELRTSIKRV